MCNRHKKDGFAFWQMVLNTHLINTDTRRLVFHSKTVDATGIRFNGPVITVENESFEPEYGDRMSIYMNMMAPYDKKTTDPPYFKGTDGTIKSLTPRQVADLLGHSTSQITEVCYVRKDTARLNGITDDSEI